MKKIVSLTLLVLIVNTIIVNADTTADISVTTAEEVYYSRVLDVRDIIDISGQVTLDGSPVSNYRVGLLVEKPSTEPRPEVLYIRTITIGTPPPQLPEKAYPLSITTVDSNGDPQETFSAGDGPSKKVTVNVIVHNEGYFTNVTGDTYWGGIRTVVMVVDSEGAVIGVKSHKDENFERGTYQTYDLSISLPSWTSNGQATVYAGCYSADANLGEYGWLDEGNVPLCSERITNFNVVDGNDTPSNIKYSASGNSTTDTYRSVFKLPPVAHSNTKLIREGIYEVHATSEIIDVEEVRLHTSDSFEIKIAGDFADAGGGPTGDGKLTFEDLIQFVFAYGEADQYGIINPLANFDEEMEKFGLVPPDEISFNDIVYFILQWNTLDF